MVSEFELKGLKQVQEKMKGLTSDLQKKGIKAALGKAARLVRDAAKQNALRVDDPETGRRIADNIVTRTRGRYNRQTGDVKVSVGVATQKGRIPKGNPDEGVKGNTPHWHLVEEGTELSKAQPFLRPALANNTEQAASTFVQELDRQITKALEK
ncbi:MAG: HK97-gp10 family putative phage morphogenesis protein [Alcaligenes sp.]